MRREHHRRLPAPPGVRVDAWMLMLGTILLGVGA
jgi:hypothetical protein